MTWILFALAGAVFAALVAVLGKIGLQGIDTTLATFLEGNAGGGFNNRWGNSHDLR